jgi:hypothetical protein
MGYFSNGSEGDFYQAQYCRRCVHDRENAFCPVWDLHMLYNYDQLKKPATRSALAMFIPEQDGGNGQCSMFVERGQGSGGGEPVPVARHLTVVRAA